MSTPDSESTVVQFRVFKSGGDILAIFPGHEGAKRYLCGSYQHVGQHGDCDGRALIALTRPAQPYEYCDLASELTSIGYVLNVKERLSSKDYWWNKKEMKMKMTKDKAIEYLKNHAKSMRILISKDAKGQEYYDKFIAAVEVLSDAKMVNEGK